MLEFPSQMLGNDNALWMSRPLLAGFQALFSIRDFLAHGLEVSDLFLFSLTHTYCFIYI